MFITHHSFSAFPLDRGTNRFIPFLGTAGSSLSVLVLAVLVGCNSGTDLTEYQSVEQTKRAAIPNVDDPIVVQTVNEPILEPTSPLEATTNGKPTGIGDLATGEESLTVSALVPLNAVDGASLASLIRAQSGDSRSVTSSEVAPASATNTSNPAAATEPRKVEVLIPTKTFRKEGKPAALRVTYDDLDLLKVLNMDPVTPDAAGLMPDWLKGLNGQRIRLKGVMFPTFEAEGLERFVLARDSQACCFGPGAKVYDLIQVELKPGKTTDYIPFTRFFDVVGTFKIHLEEAEGKVYSLYALEDAEVFNK